MYNTDKITLLSLRMNFQEIAVVLSVLFAIVFLIKKFFWKKKSEKNCGDDDCGCH